MKYEDEEKRSLPVKELIQIGVAHRQTGMTVREMFEHMARREGEIIQEARQRAMKRIRADSTG